MDIKWYAEKRSNYIRVVCEKCKHEKTTYEIKNETNENCWECGIKKEITK